MTIIQAIGLKHFQHFLLSSLVVHILQDDVQTLSDL